MFDVLLLLFLIGMNAAAYGAFWIDKRAAIAGARRIPEDRLLALAFLGGSIGAKAAQMVLRHKTTKEPFRTQLNGIIAIHVVLLAALFALRYAG